MVRAIKIILGLIPGIILGVVLAVLTGGVLVSTRVTAVIWLDHHHRMRRARQRRTDAHRVRRSPACRQRAAGGCVLDDDPRRRPPDTLRPTQLRPALPGGRPSAEQRVLVADDGDAQNHFVPNPIDRYAVGDRSGLVPNADGSVDIYIQNAAPADHESNWLPAPAGDFHLWLRVYLPGSAVIDGTYTVPAVQEVQ